MEEIMYAGSPIWVRATATALERATITISVWDGLRSTKINEYVQIISKDVVAGNIVTDISDIIRHEIANPSYSGNGAVWVEILVNVNNGEYTNSIIRLATGGYVAGDISQTLIASSGSSFVTSLLSLTAGDLVQNTNTVFHLEDMTKDATRFAGGDTSNTAFTIVTLNPAVVEPNRVSFIEPSYRFSPLKLRFENRFGVKEEIWLAKRSKPSIKVKSNSYTRSNFNYNTLSYDPTSHVEQQYNTVGYMSWRTSTGWMPIEFNGVIEDIFLSNNLWLEEEDGTIHPVMLKNKTQVFKQILNETVIEYSWDFEGTNPINNVIR